MDTKGKIEVVDGHYPFIREIRGLSFKLSAVVYANDLTTEDVMRREADLCRIAACWNACIGISTERLEQLDKPLMQHLFGADANAAALVTQRDELLDACRKAIYALKGREHDGFLRDAIARAEGKEVTQ